MFGYITPLYKKLTLEEYYYFKSYYCGLCYCIKNNYGNLSRLTLNYDLTFIGFLLDGLINQSIDTTSVHCIKHINTKTSICKPTDSLNYVSSINIIMSSLKLKDDIIDDNSLKSKIFFIMLHPAEKKAKKHLVLLTNKIYLNMKKLSEYENGKSFNSLDEICHPFSAIMGDILKYYPGKFFNDSLKLREKLYSLGYLMGKWIYLMDALDDLYDDLKNSKFNPINTLYNTDNLTFENLINNCINDVDSLLFNCLSSCNDHIDSIPFQKHFSIIKNVFDLGMVESYYKVILKYQNLLKESSESAI